MLLCACRTSAAGRFSGRSARNLRLMLASCSWRTMAAFSPEVSPDSGSPRRRSTCSTAVSFTGAGGLSQSEQAHQGVAAAAAAKRSGLTHGSGLGLELGQHLLAVLFGGGGDARVIVGEGEVDVRVVNLQNGKGGSDPSQVQPQLKASK